MNTPITVLADHVEYLEALGDLERSDWRARHEKVASASEDRAPLWLRLQSSLIVAALHALAAGRYPEMTMREAVATCGEPAEEIERALAQIAFSNELERKRRKPVPAIGDVYPIQSKGT